MSYSEKHDPTMLSRIEPKRKYAGLWVFWLGLLLLIFFFLSVIHDILLPFAVAFIFAYFLNPAACFLEKRGLSRNMSVSLILSIFFICLIFISIFLVPIIYEQLSSLLHKAPLFIERLKNDFLPYINNWKDILDPPFIELQQGSNISVASGWIMQWGGRMITSFIQSSLSFMNIASLLFISPILLFYILRDWDKMMNTIDNLLPPSYAPLIREQIYAIDHVLSGYLRGQFQVCLFLSFFYSTCLMMTGLHYSLFIGCTTGFLAFMPYVGFIFGFIISLILCFLQYGPDVMHMGYIVAIFILGQILEGNFVTPKLVGEKVGLHPVWIIFGLLAGGTLFGFVGILFAMPVTAIIGVLLRFGLREYKKSFFFLG